MADRVYRRFDRDDVYHTTIRAQSLIVVERGYVSPSNKPWTGNTNAPSGALSLYDGIRARSDVGAGSTVGVSLYPIDHTREDANGKVLFYTGSYPATGSVSIAEVTSAAGPNPTDELWYDQHFSIISNLYSWYGSRISTTYNTQTLDFYTPLFLSSTSPVVVFSSSAYLNNLSSSQFTMEARIRPRKIYSGSEHDVISRSGTFYLGLTGSASSNSASLFFTIQSGSNVATLSSSVTFLEGEWHHIAVTRYSGFDPNNSYAPATATALVMDGVALTTSYAFNSNWVPSPVNSDLIIGSGFYRGEIYESRIWNIGRSISAISGSMLRRLTAAEIATGSLVHYAKFNEGSGSSVVEYARASGFGMPAVLSSGSPGTKFWNIASDPSFSVTRNLSPTVPSKYKVVHIPEMYYGRQIATGSVRITDRSLRDTPSYGSPMDRVIIDDGTGRLHYSGSDPVDRVGNVFYSEGLMVFTDPVLVADFASGTFSTSSMVTIKFNGDTITKSQVFACRMYPGEVNASNNPTYYRSGSDGLRHVKMEDRPENVTYISAIGIYNEDRQLVAVAKFAQPIRKRERDQTDIRIKLDI